jgi:hypothetical protein
MFAEVIVTDNAFDAEPAQNGDAGRTWIWAMVHGYSADHLGAADRLEPWIWMRCWPSGDGQCSGL